MERVGLRHASFLPLNHLINMSTNSPLIPARTSPGLTRSALPVPHQGRSVKLATGAKTTIRGRNNISVGTWNVRTLHAAGRLEQLTHELNKYRWHLLGLCEVRWKHSGEELTPEGHKFLYCGREDKHEHGVGFLVHKDTVHTIIGCEPISSRLMKIRLRATPFNITVVQVYAPTSDYDDNKIEEFYEQLQAAVASVPSHDILVVQGDWNAKVGTDAQRDWKETCGPHCNEITNSRGLRLLEFASTNQLCVANTYGTHKPSRKWTWHSPGGRYHSQIDYILIKRRFKSSVKTAGTRTFPGADVGSDHDLVMMTMKLRLRRTKKTLLTREKFDLEKLKCPTVADAYQTTLHEKITPLLKGAGTDIEATLQALNVAITDTAKATLGRYRKPKKPWISNDILEMCDKRSKLKGKKNRPGGMNAYRIMNRQIKKSIAAAKQAWMRKKCKDIETNLRFNNSKTAYQLVKELTERKDKRSSPILDKQGNRLTEDDKILERWTEYCTDLYNLKTEGDPEVLDVPEPSNKGDFPILKDEVKAAIKSLKRGKSPGLDNIPAELIIAGGESMVSILTAICNHIWQTGVWPSAWTRSLIITIPKKGNLQHCQNYRTISLISHSSKVMLKVMLKRLVTQAEKIIKEEQAGFRAGRSTTEQIFNLRVLCEKYLQHQQELYHVFIDFRKAFDRVWHDALWATMKLYNIDEHLINIIKALYSKASSAVFHNKKVGEWFHTTVGVRQGCLLSPTLFNIFLERIMDEALKDHRGTVSIGGRNITNLRFADDIDGLAGTIEELGCLVDTLDETVCAFGMEINGSKTKIMTNKPSGFTTTININGDVIEPVDSFKYLGVILSDEGSKKEVLSRIAQAAATMYRLNKLWKNKSIEVKFKIRLMRSLVTSILLYACESWTLTSELEKRINSAEMMQYRRLLQVRYYHFRTNEDILQQIENEAGTQERLLTTAKKRKLRWFGHVVRSAGLSKTVLQGTVNGGRKRGRQKKRWEDNIKKWTGLFLGEAMEKANKRSD